MAISLSNFWNLLDLLLEHSIADISKSNSFHYLFSLFTGKADSKAGCYECLLPQLLRNASYDIYLKIVD